MVFRSTYEKKRKELLQPGISAKLWGIFNVTSILSGKSSASVISELKVYSDSLLL